jgi:nitrogen fixation/metabolism regulation signal transduction histidine kinase
MVDKKMNDIWKEYAGDFNSMTDAEIQEEVDDERQKLDEAESWLEAVASWIAAGRPRDKL